MSYSIVDDLFRASPPPVRTAQGFLDHNENWVDRAEGAEDFLETLSHVAKVVEFWAPPLSQASQVAARVKEAFDQVCSGLSIPLAMADLNALRHSVLHLSSNTCTRTARAVKDVAMRTLLLVNTSMRVVLFFPWALTALQIARASGVASATALITDGSDLIRDCLEWQKADQSVAASRLALINVMKNVSSVAISSLMLASYACVSVASAPWLAGTSLTLSTVYVVSNVTSYFYKNMKVAPSNA